MWKLTLGEPEGITPCRVRRSRPAIPAHDQTLNEVDGLQPHPVESIGFRTHARGCTILLPYERTEGIFGLGLQLKSFLQSGKKKHLRVNADPVADTGDSHAPVPFFVSTAGYGIYLDTARYASFYFGTHVRNDQLHERVKEKWEKKTGAPTHVPELYASNSIGRHIVADIPAARGIDVYYFAGPDLKKVVQRYNLFSGGGFIPPLWGLGNWYRTYTNHGADEVLELLGEIEQDRMPFSVIGLEPGWQTHFYPNSFSWSNRFPDPEGFARTLHAKGYRLNLWENAFVHPDAPFAESIRPHCGDQPSTDGLAPDFLDPTARRIFADHHAELVRRGADGFKLDECDNGDFLPFAWSFPEHSQFPSGADGEQMHCLYGVHYQHTLARVFEKIGVRQFDLVRSSGALASSLPYVLYSDLYEHHDFIRGLVNAGFSGLLWTPEVRHADDVEDLVRRVQCVALSPLSLINGWYIPHPPWKQVDREQNEKSVFMGNARQVTGLIRDILRLRNRLVPYLYTAFAEYARSGLPPFRALVMDHPDDFHTWKCDRQLMIGRDLLAAPIMKGETKLSVYLPAGNWRNFFSGTPLEGGRWHAFGHLQLADMLLFVREGAILPLADPEARLDGSMPVPVIPHIFGAQKAEGLLYNDTAAASSRDPNPDCWIPLSWTHEQGLAPTQARTGQFALGHAHVCVGPASS